MCTGKFLVVLLCTAGLLHGCLLPIPTKEKVVLAGTPVQDEQLAFLVAHTTTKEQVIDQLGNPDMIWEEANLFAYNWEMRKGVLIWAVAGQFSMAGGVSNIGKQYALLLRFDDKDRLTRFEKVVRPTSKSYGDFLKDWIQTSHEPLAHD
jgi:outer membrane protein assembly factor BamE (lipoprotein component of BamABCDE complex)